MQTPQDKTSIAMLFTKESESLIDISDDMDIPLNAMDPRRNPPTVPESSFSSLTEPIVCDAGLKSVERCWCQGVKLHNENLNENDERRINETSDHASCTFQQLQEQAKKAKTKCDEARTNSQKKFESAMEAIQYYTPAVDIFIQQYTNITSIVWGSFRVFLAMTLQKAGIDDLIEEGMLLILLNIDTWYRNICEDPEEPSIILASAHIFKNVLRFVIEARIYCQQRYITKYFKAGLGSLPQDMQGLILSITRHAQDQHNAAVSRHIARSSHSRLEQNRQCKLREVEQIIQTEFRNESRQHQQLQQHANNKLSDLHKMSLEEEYVRNVDRAMERLTTVLVEPMNIDITPGTCEWIFNHENFNEWTAAGCSKPLWIRGIPGCGKSALATFLQKNFEPSQMHFAHFFQGTNKQSISSKSFGVSIAFRILKAMNPKVPKHRELIGDLATTCLSPDRSSEITFGLISDPIVAALNTLDSYTLIIDGLDEGSDKNDLEKFVKALLSNNSKPHPRIIILAREHPDLRSFTPHPIYLEMDEVTVKADIHLFLASRIAAKSKLGPFGNEIHAEARQNCHGSFIRASATIDYLSDDDVRYPSDLMDRLREIPRGLNNFFDKILSDGGKKRTESDLRLRREIFLLLLEQQRLLTVEELDFALQFRRRGQTHHQQLLNIRGTIHDLCRSLVTTTDDRVSLCHSTVVEFLVASEKTGICDELSIHISTEESNACLASRCFNVLSETQNQSPTRIAFWLYKNVYPEVIDSLVAKGELHFLREIVFYSYAAEYWDYHITKVKTPSRELLEQLDSFLRHNEFVYWAEYTYNLKGEVGPIASVYGDLKSWWEKLPDESKDLVSLEHFFTTPYRELSNFYESDGGDNLLKFLCLHQLGGFYTLQADLENQKEVRGTVWAGFASSLGPNNPLTLRAKAAYGFCYTVRGQLFQALKLYMELVEAQKENPGTLSPDYWESFQQVGFIQFLMTDFEDAAVTMIEVSSGWKTLPRSKPYHVLVSNIFEGYIYEARAMLPQALSLYQAVWENQTKRLGENNPMSLYAEVCMGSIYRKQKLYDSALERLDHGFRVRQELWGLEDSAVIDTAIQLIVLHRETKQFDKANTLINLISQAGGLTSFYERNCQVEHLKALILVDQGDIEAAIIILQDLLDSQDGMGREFNNRSLFWARLTLATIRRDSGRDKDVPMLFYDIVTPLNEGDSSPLFEIEQIETLDELKIAEEALRMVKSGERRDADEFLKQNDLKWSRIEDFWLFEGAPSVDTAWMEGP